MNNKTYSIAFSNKYLNPQDIIGLKSEFGFKRRISNLRFANETY